MNKSKNIALFLIAPLISLLYMVLFPFVAVAMLLSASLKRNKGEQAEARSASLPD